MVGPEDLTRLVELRRRGAGDRGVVVVGAVAADRGVRLVRRGRRFDEAVGPDVDEAALDVDEVRARVMALAREDAEDVRLAAGDHEDPAAVAAGVLLVELAREDRGAIVDVDLEAGLDPDVAGEARAARIDARAGLHGEGAQVAGADVDPDVAARRAVGGARMLGEDARARGDRAGALHQHVTRHGDPDVAGLAAVGVLRRT